MQNIIWTWTPELQISKKLEYIYKKLLEEKRSKMKNRFQISADGVNICG
jgi:hypothetical protein